jgi:guanylate kinase
MSSGIDQPVRGRLYVVSAPSGAGKTSLVAAVLARDPAIVVSISHTTRPARPGERDGQNYHFVNNDHFSSLIAEGAFLEHAQVFDHCYATSRTGVERELAQGRDVILEIDWQGARQVRAAWPDTRSIFILPPSLDTLRERLASRGQDSTAVIERRMTAARTEIGHWHEYDYVVVNTNFERTVADLQAIFVANRLCRDDQAVRQSQLICALLS